LEKYFRIADFAFVFIQITMNYINMGFVL